VNYFSLLALCAGAAIAVQAGMNAQLGVLLKNPLLSAAVTFVVACVCVMTVVLITARELPSLINVQTVPVHLWFSGAISAFGVASFYFLIPRMGVGAMMSFGLTGQLLVAMLISHWGFFDLPVKSINLSKLLGVIAMIAGIVLINKD
jgi:bacterial/archaeal transporter family-2 protein